MNSGALQDQEGWWEAPLPFAGGGGSWIFLRAAGPSGSGGGITACSKKWWSGGRAWQSRMLLDTLSDTHVQRPHVSSPPAQGGGAHSAPPTPSLHPRQGSRPT